MTYDTTDELLRVVINNKNIFSVGESGMEIINDSEPLEMIMTDETSIVFPEDNPLVITSVTPLIVDTSITQLNQSNFPTIIYITSPLTGSLPVDTGIESLTISNFPTQIEISDWDDIIDGNIQVGLLHTESDTRNIVTEETMNMLALSTDRYSHSLPFDKQFMSQAVLIYSSQYPLWSTPDEIDVLEDAESVDSVATVTDYGLEINQSIAGTHTQLCRFYTPIQGRTMFIYSFVNPHRNLEEVSWTHEFGLVDKDGNRIRIEMFFSGVVANTYIKILVDMLDQSGATTTMTILQSNFGIDMMGGTGGEDNPSGFEYKGNSSGGKFWIMTDSQYHYTFGLLSGTNLIPFHSFSLAGTVASSLLGHRLTAYRPYFKTYRETIGTATSLMWHGFTIYKDSETIATPINQSIYVLKTNSETDTFYPILIMRYRDPTEYVGNIQLKTMTMKSAINMRIQIRYGNSANSLVYTGESFVNYAGNIEYDIDADTISDTSGHVILSFVLLADEMLTVDLSDLIGWEYFNYDYAMTESSEICVEMLHSSAIPQDCTIICNFTQF